jgi:hypothetical protein
MSILDNFDGTLIAIRGRYLEQALESTRIAYELKS